LAFLTTLSLAETTGTPSLATKSIPVCNRITPKTGCSLFPYSLFRGWYRERYFELYDLRSGDFGIGAHNSRRATTLVAAVD
jgi:hypothetical protein